MDRAELLDKLRRALKPRAYVKFSAGSAYRWIRIRDAEDWTHLLAAIEEHGVTFVSPDGDRKIEITVEAFRLGEVG